MSAKLLSLVPGRCLVFIPGITLAVLMTGCGSMDFTSVSLKYPVYPAGGTEPNAITSTVTVADKRQDRSTDHLVKIPVIQQVREQVTQDLQSTGRFIVVDGSRAKYSLQVEVEQLNSEVPGYATRSVTNALLSEATMGLSNFITPGTGINVVGHVRLHAILSESGKRVVWDEIFSGQYGQTASMQAARAHAVEGSVLTFALQEAIGKLKGRVLQLAGKS